MPIPILQVFTLSVGGVFCDSTLDIGIISIPNIIITRSNIKCNALTKATKANKVPPPSPIEDDPDLVTSVFVRAE